MLRLILEKSKRHDAQGYACFALAESIKAQSQQPANKAKSEELSKEAEALYEQGRLAEAGFQFKKALSLDPNNPEAQRYLAYTQGAGPDTTLSGRFSRLE